MTRFAADQPTVRVYEVIETELPKKTGQTGSPPTLREKGKLLGTFHTYDGVKLATGLTVSDLKATINSQIKTYLAKVLPNHPSTTTDGGTEIVRVVAHDQTRIGTRGVYDGKKLIAEIDFPESII